MMRVTHLNENEDRLLYHEDLRGSWVGTITNEGKLTWWMIPVPDHTIESLTLTVKGWVQEWAHGDPMNPVLTDEEVEELRKEVSESLEAAGTDHEPGLPSELETQTAPPAAKSNPILSTLEALKHEEQEPHPTTPTVHEDDGQGSGSAPLFGPEDF